MRPRGRLVALLALVAAAVAAVAVLSSGGGDKPRSAARRSAASQPAAPHAGGNAQRRVRGPHDRPVPILMYHVIASPKPGAPYPEL